MKDGIHAIIPFYEQVLNGNLYPKDNMVSKGNRIQQGK